MPATPSGWPTTRSRPCARSIEDLPATDAAGKASFPVKLDKIAGDLAPARSRRSPCSMAESGGRAVERKLTLPIAPDAPMIGVKPAFSGRSLGDGANADFDVVDGRARRQAAGAKRPALRAAAGSRRSYQWYRQNGHWEYEPVKRTERVANGTRRCRRRQAGADFAAGEMGALSPGSVDRRAERRRSPRSPSMPASMRKPTPIRPICSKSRSTSRIINPATP